MSNTTPCLCEEFEHPATIENPPGRDTITYRVGDYTSFRHALLLSRPGEIELENWRPGASGDLAVQMIEWWAYLSDILTFYNERIANQDYLRTADLTESVTRLIQVLGYRPRPGIGAHGFVSALLTGPKPVHLDQIFALQSKPGPGKQPQVFELDSSVDLNLPDAVAADPAPNPGLFGPDGHSVLLKGSISDLKPGTPLLVVAKNWNGTDSHYALVTVTGTTIEKDPRGKPNTRVQLSVQSSGIPNGSHAVDYQLMRSAQTGHVWQYPADSGLVVEATDLHADSLLRNITPGQMVLLEIPDTFVLIAFEEIASIKTKAAKKKKHTSGNFGTQQGGTQFLTPPDPRLVSITSYSEDLWFVNPKSTSDPSVGPDPTTIGIPILHSILSFQPSLTTSWDSFRSGLILHFNFSSVGELIPTPVTEFDGVSTALTAVAPALFPTGNGQSIQIEDGLGNGIQAFGSVGTDRTKMTLSGLPVPAVKLQTPLKVLFDLMPISRGKSVLNEILGSGDATQTNQEFVLAKSPLTYLLSGSSTSGGSYKSTLRVWVDGLEWSEVPNFYAQPATARIFVTAEDENQKTHVKFGDGIEGARLSSGVNNVVATYRYGSGKDAPDVGTLNVILQARPGLKSIRNPVAVGGGDDPDPADKIRQYAPKSVLTFGRAVSGDDYEAVAASTPGVSRAKAYWGWDDSEQRTIVTVYVGDDQSAKDAAIVALNGASDPNRPLKVELAKAIPIAISLHVEFSSDRQAPDIVNAVTSAIVDPDTGLLGTNNIAIGQLLYESQIYEACLSVPGTIAIHGLQFSANRGSGMTVESSFRYDPGEGAFFQLATTDLQVFP